MTRPTHITGVFTDRQASVIRAIAEAEEITLSDLVRRAVFGYVWGTLDMQVTQPRPAAVLRLHDFPRIAHALAEAEARDLEQAGAIHGKPMCADCGLECVDLRGLAIHRGHKHKKVAA